MVEKSNEELLQALVEEHCSQETLHMLDIPDDVIGIGKGAEEVKTSGKVDELEGNTSKEINHTQTDTQVPTHSEMVNQGCTDINPKSTPLTSPTNSNGNQTEATDSTSKTPLGTRDHLCSECKLVRLDPTEKELVMYLHALRYKGPDFEYSTSLPDWAKEDWVEAD